jgi:hypothetical protein
LVAIFIALDENSSVFGLVACARGGFGAAFETPSAILLVLEEDYCSGRYRWHDYRRSC